MRRSLAGLPARRSRLTRDNPHLEASEAISAMIRVTMRYTDITGQVASQLRLERAAAKDRKAPPIITGPDTIDRP